MGQNIFVTSMNTFLLHVASQKCYCWIFLFLYNILSVFSGKDAYMVADKSIMGFSICKSLVIIQVALDSEFHISK